MNIADSIELKYSTITQPNIISKGEIQANATKSEHICQCERVNCPGKVRLNQTNRSFFYDNLGYG